MSATADMAPDGTGKFYKGTVADGVTGPWVLLPQDQFWQAPTVVGNPDSATYRIEFTVSSLEDIDGDDEVPVPWTAGDVAAIDSESFVSRIRAVRAVNVGGGSLDWELFV